MKTSVKILSLAVIVFLSACSTSDKFSVMKRKYRPGYYVDFGKKVNKAESNTVSNNESKAANNIQAQTSNIAENNTSSASDASPIEKNNYPLTASADNKVYKSTSINNKKINNTEAIKALSPNRIVAKRINKVIAKAGKPNNRKSSSDDMLILEIILCFFPILALIAIYLKDGKSITLNFWIDLLLHFVFLYWLFALLVVLDVINLA